MGLFDKLKKAFTLEEPTKTSNKEDATTAEQAIQVNEQKEQQAEIEATAETVQNVIAKMDAGEIDETTVEKEEQSIETNETLIADETAPAQTVQAENEIKADIPAIKLQNNTTTIDTDPQQSNVEEDLAAQNTTTVVEEIVYDETTNDIFESTTQKKYDKGLEKTRKTFKERMNELFANFRSVDEDFFEELEETLIGADVGFETSMKIADELRQEVKLKNAKKPAAVQNIIIEKLVNMYEAEGMDEVNALNVQKDNLTVMLFVGVNGVGKTTSIGKLAHQYKQEGKKVMLAAADTFRAGAIDQLVVWGERADVEVVRGQAGGDPAAVVFDAMQRAKAENVDVLLIDTAGRLQNKVNLMNELDKIKRIIQREKPDAPHEVLLVLDATTGQNAMSQAKQFKETTDVTGLVLTKLDGTAKGGIVLAIRNELHLPVKLVGLGEGIDDLEVFKPNDFVIGLFKGLIEAD